jgi:hypothetical protein
MDAEGKDEERKAKHRQRMAKFRAKKKAEKGQKLVTEQDREEKKNATHAKAQAKYRKKHELTLHLTDSDVIKSWTTFQTVHNGSTNFLLRLLLRA